MIFRAIRFAHFKHARRAESAATAALSMWLAMSCLFVCGVASAEVAVQGRVLTRGEGQAIVDAISERRALQDGHRTKPDCSHLVNDVYNVAGYSYAYAKSSDLYRGHPSFVRVKFPQPGDLIVWRGHVGLVTDPREHLFYSSLRSGLDVEDYTSPYWTKHGTPRFYRYRTLNDKPYLLTRTNMRERDQRSETGFSAMSVKQSTKDDEDEETLNTKSVSAAPGILEAASTYTSSSRLSGSIPVEILIATGRDKPTVEKANLAISKMNQSLVAAADPQALLQSAASVAIVTNLQVIRLQIKGNRGWAYIDVDSKAYLREGELDKAARHEEEWEMMRSKLGWKVLVPAGRIYLNRRDATRIFAHQLAQLAEKSESERSESGVSEEGRLASVLNGLLNN